MLEGLGHNASGRSLVMTPEYPFLRWLACPSRRRAQLSIPGRMQVPCCVRAAQNYVATSVLRERRRGGREGDKIEHCVC
jgi:hypothetical protein